MREERNVGETGRWLRASRAPSDTDVLIENDIEKREGEEVRTALWCSPHFFKTEEEEEGMSY